MTQSPDPAKVIYQRLLDAIGGAHASDDFEAYATCFELPHIVETFERRTVIETREQLRTAFDALRAQLDLAGVTTLTRICTVAEFIGEETIHGGHDTWLITSTHVIRDRYSALTTLRRSETGWRLQSGQYATNEKSIPVALVNKLTSQHPGRAVMFAETPIADPAE